MTYDGSTFKQACESRKLRITHSNLTQNKQQRTDQYKIHNSVHENDIVTT